MKALLPLLFFTVACSSLPSEPSDHTTLAPTTTSFRCNAGQIPVDYYYTDHDSGWFCITPFQW